MPKPIIRHHSYRFQLYSLKSSPFEEHPPKYFLQIRKHFRRMTVLNMYGSKILYFKLQSTDRPKHEILQFIPAIFALDKLRRRLNDVVLKLILY